MYADLLQMLGSGLAALTGERFTFVEKVVGGLARLNGRLLASGRSGAELTVRAVNETSFAQLVIVPPRQGGGG